MKILITGGAGFLGTHLVRYWGSKGHQISVLNTKSKRSTEFASGFNSNVEVIWGSVEDYNTVKNSVKNKDLIVHLAAKVNVDQSVVSPKDYFATNLDGTINILEAARKFGVKVLYESSREVYGDMPVSPVSEETELKPKSPYALSKASADRICYGYHTSYGVEVMILRSCNVYGANQRAGKLGAFIPRLVEQALSGGELTIYGSGNQKREYIHVSDLVRAHDLLINKGEFLGEAINVGTNHYYSVKEIAEKISGRLSSQILNVQSRQGEIPGFVLDSNLIRSMGFVPRVDFWKGLDDYMDYCVSIRREFK